MTFIAAVTAIGSILAALVFFIRACQYNFGKTPEEKKEQIDGEVAMEEKRAHETGRP